jgi:hypothetical protein
LQGRPGHRSYLLSSEGDSISLYGKAESGVLYSRSSDTEVYVKGVPRAADLSVPVEIYHELTYVYPGNSVIAEGHGNPKANAETKAAEAETRKNEKEK